MNIELQHLHKAAECLKRFENKEWQQVIPKGNSVAVEIYLSKDYVRDVLKNTVYLTGHKEAYEDVNNLPKIMSSSNGKTL